MNDEFKIIKFEKIKITECYENIWSICIKCDKKEIKKIRYQDGLLVLDKGDYIEVQLIRFIIEPDEIMEKLLKSCDTLQDVCRLHTVIWYSN